MKLKVLDLFSGIGGMSLGFKQAGFEIVAANELDIEIAESYKKNHPEVKMYNTDITSLDSEILEKYRGKINIVIGGPPCQGFSQKGSRNILEDERNFLFKEFYRIVKFLEPEYFLMENVPNILTANNGSFKHDISKLFEKLDYKLDSAVLNAADYGVPQYRKRAFILGSLNKKKYLPLGIFNKDYTTIWDAISDLSYLDSGQGDFEQAYKYNSQNKYQKSLRTNSKKLFNHITTNHSQIALDRLRLIPEGKGKEVLPPEHLTKSIYSGTWCRMIKNDPSVTITTRFDTPASGKFTHPYLHRAITVREAARIQSFPDEIIFYGTKMSQMKQVGNAVPPMLAYSIAKNILT